MVVGVVDLYLKLWRRNADIIVIGGPRRLGSACRVEKRPSAMYFHTSLSQLLYKKRHLEMLDVIGNNYVF